MVPYNKSIIFLALALAYGAVSFGQVKEDQLKNIRQTFQKINSNKRLAVVKVDNEDIPGEKTDGGQQLIGYFEGDSIRKLYLWVGLSNGVREYECYYAGGQVVFIFETEKGFHVNDSLGSMDPTKLDLLFEGRYYLDQGKLIDLKTKGQKRFGDNNAAAFVQDVITRSKSLTKMLRSRLK